MSQADEPRGCCDCGATARIEHHFDAKVRERVASGGQATLAPVSGRLKDALLALDPRGRTVLDLGCGAGAMVMKLLAAGAARASGVDLSRASIEDAQRQAERAGFGGRAEFAVGDVAQVALERHDWVILDRVICCYPDVERLLANSIPAAASVYAFSVPASRGWRGRAARITWAFDNLLDRLRRSSCPGFVHDVDVIEGRLRDAGFRLRRRDSFRLWYIAIFERQG